MSLKTKLHVSIVGLVAILVFILTLLNLQIAADVEFRDVLEHAQSAARQIQALVAARVTERTAAREHAPANLDEMKRIWAGIIEDDPALSSLLRQTTANTRAAAAILIYDESRRVLNSSDPGLTGKQAPSPPVFSQWDRKSLPARMNEIYSRRRDYEVTVGLGIPGNTQPLFTVQVLINSVLLRGVVGPQLSALGVVSLIALGLSVVAAALASNVILRPLHRISRTIDRISQGELPQALGKSEAQEIAAVESKLNLLGEQYRGVRKDALQLRGNIEQLFERLEEAVFLFGADGRLLIAGKPAERFLGKGRWEMMGQSFGELFPEPSAVGQAIDAAIGLRRQVKDQPVEISLDGRPPSQVSLTVEPLESYGTRVLVGTLVTLRDAETRKQIENELDLSSRMAAISRLTGGVAHEIKNPLNAIALHLEVLRARLERELPEPEPEIEVISREVRRLDRVVKTFLDFTRPVQLKLQDLDLSELAREVSGLVGPECERSRISVSCQEEAPCAIRADRDLLKQALLNVVVNAVEAMPDGGKLKIATALRGPQCELVVEDNGPGIPAEIRDKIFNLYFSTKKKGSGIGLAMTFQVVQLHNGTIELTSEPGNGATFRFRFPVIQR